MAARAVFASERDLFNMGDNRFRLQGKMDGGLASETVRIVFLNGNIRGIAEEPPKVTNLRSYIKCVAKNAVFKVSC